MYISVLSSFFVALFVLSHAEAGVKTTFIIKNHNKKALTVKVMPNDMKLDAIMATIGAGYGVGLMNDHKKKIAPTKDGTIEIKPKVMLLKTGTADLYDKPVDTVRISGTIGFRKPGTCTGIALDGKTKIIEFQKHLLGTKCVVIK
ncbi:MAG TPA: hypothetical protein DD412_02790 [Holosporales bacterium]|nr:hypothetical protein [Holosporales bacterium]